MPIPIDVDRMPHYIELRQFEVPYLNARRYFWVMRDGLNNVVDELHGHPASWKTGRRLSFSWGGDQLKFFRSRRPEEYPRSRHLPHVVAFEGTKKDVLDRWNTGIGTGQYLNKTRTN